MKRLAAVLTLVLPITCGAQQPRAPKPGVYQISGRILSAVNGQPLAGATVSLAPAATANTPERPINAGPRRPFRPQRQLDDEILAVVSAADGTFSFSGLRAGKYSLSAEKRGFSQQRYEQHDEYSTAIVVGPDKDPGELLFRIQPDASLVGRVFDDHNEPVANAQVMLFRQGVQNGRRGIYRAQMVQTNDEGLYRFAHIRAGKFYVAVAATPW